jgi:hypothetical protein
LRNSRAVRFELLAGILDSDGYLNVNRQFDFITKSERLAQQVAFLCRSLGMSCTPKKVSKGIKSRGFVGEYWRFYISGPLYQIPTKIKRKKAGPYTYARRTDLFGVKVEPAESGKYAGIVVDGNNLYCHADFTVTHN